MRIVTALLVACTLVLPAWACPPLNMTFQGTAFAQKPFQVEGQRIYFFRGSQNEISFRYSKKLSRWCYASVGGVENAPKAACLQRALKNGQAKIFAGRHPLPHFVLRDPRGRAVGVVSVVNTLLTVKFLDGAGKSTGKRVVFKEVLEKAGNELEVHGWNCPNARYLSCVGAQLRTIADSEAPVESPLVQVAELAKRMGHYHASCAGLYEK